MYPRSSHGPTVRATLVAVLAALEEADRQLLRLSDLDALDDDLLGALRATAYARLVARDAAEAVTPMD